MKIVLLIRRNKDYWLNNQMIFEGIVSKYFEENIRSKSFIWNICFRMKYLDFRKRLSYISSLSYSPNKFDNIIPYFDIDRINDLEPGTLIVPMDDDDWFSPDLVKNLREIKDPSKGIYWDQYAKLINGELQHQNKHTHRHIDSCCYSLKTPCDHKFIIYHWLIRKNDMDHISKRLSVKVEALSGISFQCLLNIKKDLTIQNYQEYVRKNLLLNIRSSDIFPEEYSNQEELYKELLKELLESQIGDMV